MFVLLLLIFSLVKSPALAEQLAKKESAKDTIEKKTLEKKEKSFKTSAKAENKKNPGGEPKKLDKKKSQTSEKTLPQAKMKNLKGEDKKDEKSIDQKASVAKKGEAPPKAADPASLKNQPQKLPLPRFVCIKASSANLHVGPGDQYPVEWRYVRAFLPVEIIAEFDHWRQIRDSQGTTGWLHKTLLSSKRFAMIQNKVVNFYADSNLESRVIATLEPGVVGKVLECNTLFCKLDVQGIRGWIKRDFLFGVYPDEHRF